MRLYIIYIYICAGSFEMGILCQIPKVSAENSLQINKNMNHIASIAKEAYQNEYFMTLVLIC